MARMEGRPDSSSRLLSDEEAACDMCMVRVTRRRFFMHCSRLAYGGFRIFVNADGTLRVSCSSALPLDRVTGGTDGCI